MAKTVIALHDDRLAAQRSIQELIDNGFIADDISFVIPEAEAAPAAAPALFSDNIFMQNLPAAKAAPQRITAQAMNVPGIGKVQTGDLWVWNSISNPARHSVEWAVVYWVDCWAP